MIQSESKPTSRQGGREKAPVVVKMRIDPKTAMKILALKPNSLSMSSFCSMLTEHGMDFWEKWDRQRHADNLIETYQHEREWAETDKDALTEQRLDEQK